MDSNDYGGFVERPPLSNRLKVDTGEKKAPSSFQRPRREGIQDGGLAALNVNYQKPVKRKRKGQPDKLTEGYEEGSEGYEAWLEEQEQPGIEGLTGEEKHFLSMLQNEGLVEDNFF